jgi:predicted nucleotidyltransferase
MNILDYQNQLKKICKNNDISYLALFGSHSRGESKNDSDVDMLVDYSTSKSYFDHVRIQRSLAELLGKDVDLVTRRALHPYIKDNVYKDLKVLYGK